MLLIDPRIVIYYNPVTIYVWNVEQEIFMYSKNAGTLLAFLAHISITGRHRHRDLIHIEMAYT